MALNAESLTPLMVLNGFAFDFGKMYHLNLHADVNEDQKAEMQLNIPLQEVPAKLERIFLNSSIPLRCCSIASDSTFVFHTKEMSSASGKFRLDFSVPSGMRSLVGHLPNNEVLADYPDNSPVNRVFEIGNEELRTIFDYREEHHTGNSCFG